MTATDIYISVERDDETDAEEMKNFSRSKPEYII
jgi:hypothetical protein